MDSALASRLSGLLYGNILHRDSDGEGYRYHFEVLRDDRVPLSEIITEFFTSTEFIDKFVVNQTPNELVWNLLHSFFSPASVSDSDHSRQRHNLVHAGLDHVIRQLLADQRFTDRHGATGIPRYLEGARSPAESGGSD